ncbi:hypothetical protein [Chondrinema litorale]|uniref:hypothetical protein n=1 Tax=Chondrinema litorale TaxID=2994555 RepID=UPI000C4DEC73|nr:hypothetical protein [Chondrinema litorale]MBT30652.1 hypothetical protein [Thalassovita sp.]UZR98626.1 hypothetical protein OQ292_32880 [Chondrinema litorale]
MPHRINTEIAKAFFELQKELPFVIRSYGMTKSYIVRETGIPRTTFDRKIKERKFTADEMIRICEVINR